ANPGMRAKTTVLQGLLGSVKIAPATKLKTAPHPVVATAAFPVLKGFDSALIFFSTLPLWLHQLS
ncbi:hypothetical protein, partial [Escherichia coli]|uniref:hypothetical protein n=1 Tax=Escherichia coli TaxID=562 RepID=UPI00289A87FB